MRRNKLDRNEWRERINPVFVQYWRAKKRLDLAKPNDDKAWSHAFDEGGAASRLLAVESSKIQNSIYMKIWPEIVRPLDGEVWPHRGEAGKAYAVNPEASAFFRDLVFLKLGMTYRELITQAERDPAAHRKLLSVHQEYYRVRWKGGFKNRRLKFDLVHFSIITEGLDFGLDKLNEWEIASCFDEICPCAQRHSSEYLKKLRTRIKKACERLVESRNKPTSFIT